MGVNLFTSVEEVIGRIDIDLQLDNSDWIAKAPLWFTNCLIDLDILPALESPCMSLRSCVAPRSSPPE